MTTPSLEYILHYLKYDEFSPYQIDDDYQIQRILWLSDYFKLGKFQTQYIKEVLITLFVKHYNCIFYLNEAFKKLKMSENSLDCWYLLFNSAMTTTAKNLVWNIQNKKKDLMSINEKILDEIIERSIRSNKLQFWMDQKEIIDLLCFSRKKNNIFELLESQRQLILTKKAFTSITIQEIFID